MIGPREFECVGEVKLARPDPATEATLSAFAGEWLEYAPEASAIVVRHVQPGGAPALSAVPAELVALLDLLPRADRERLPGGALLLRDRQGLLLRLTVDRDGIRVHWPREDWSHEQPAEVAAVFRAVDPFSARVTGELRFAAPAGAETRLADFVESFEGLYPEGDLRFERRGGTVRVELTGVNVGPEQLLDTVLDLAHPVDSLEGDLRVESFAPHAVEQDFRLVLERGVARAARPALWPVGT